MSIPTRTGSSSSRISRPAITLSRQAEIMLKGLTAHYLLRGTHRVRAGETILVHAAAGGVGLIACQLASHLEPG